MSVLKRGSLILKFLRAKSERIFAKLKRAQSRWAQHVSIMNDSRIPKQLLYGELYVGERHKGRPKLRYKDVLKQSLHDCNINPKERENAAKDRSVWRLKVHKELTNTSLSESKKEKKNMPKERLLLQWMFHHHLPLLLQTFYLFLPVPTAKRSMWPRLISIAILAHIINIA